MLTRKQFELLQYISTYIQNTGLSPSFDEMKEALDLKSKSGIHRLITALEERGFLRRLPHRARALEVLKTPAEALPTSLRSARATTQDLTQTNISSANSALTQHKSPDRVKPLPITTVTELPLCGRIAAGMPIEALENPSEKINVPSSMLESGAEHYALEIDGESMVDAGILDGDLVIIRRCDTASNATIVVALIEGQEATLKRIYRKNNAVLLESANRNYETRTFSPGQVQVQGRLIGLLRHY